MLQNLTTTKEVAKYLKVDIGTITRWIREKKLEAIKIGKSYRIREEDLGRLVNKTEEKK